MAYDDVITRNENEELAIRTVNSSGDNYVNKDDIYTRDDEGKLCIRTVGNGGGGSIDTSKIVNADVLPTADSSNVGKFYLYKGETNASYTHGYIYECVSDGQDPATYSWTRIDVQPAPVVPDPLPDQTGNAGKFLTTDGDKPSWSNKPLVNSSTGNNSIQIMAMGNSPANAIGIGIGASVGERSVRIGSNGGSAMNDSVGIGNYVFANSYSIAIGGSFNSSNLQSVSNHSIGIGYRAQASDHGIAVGEYTTAGSYGITIKVDDATLTCGRNVLAIISGETSFSNVGSIAAGAIVLDASTKTASNVYANVIANTFNVGLGTNTIYRVLNSDGTIPVNRIASTTGLADGTYVLKMTIVDGTATLAWVLES